MAEPGGVPACSSTSSVVEEPACPGRYEYAIGFAAGKQVELLARQVLDVFISCGGLCGECVVSDKEERKYILLVSMSSSRFDEQAERDEALKLTQKDDHITGRPRLELFTRATAADFQGHDRDDFYRPSERACMVWSMLEDVRATAEACATIIEAVSGIEAYKCIRSPALGQESLVSALLRCGIVEVVCPLHEEEQRRAVWRETLAPWPLRAPVKAIRSYYGDQVALYFAWLDFFSMMLVPPSIVAALVLLAEPPEENVDNDVTISFYSFFIVIWGFVFVAMWRRRSTSLACSWDTLRLTHADLPNPSFHGFIRTSQVTGKPEIHYSAENRWFIHYPVSICVTALMLMVAFGVMSLSLNLQGYVAEGSPIFVAWLAEHSKAGGLCDANSTYASKVPGFIHTLVIMQLNKSYRHVAEWLTRQENHKFLHDHEKSLVYKRFLFEAFDCYIALFYIAFYELDIVKLRGELVSLFTSDCVRRVMTESVLPYAMHAMKVRREAAATAESKKTDGGGGAELGDIIVAELARDEYEEFDDFLEMVVQFGYVTLFAAAFVQAAPLSLAYNFIEMRSDAFKLGFISRRPRAVRAQDIGPWSTILTVIVWLSALTNVFVAGLTSEQLMHMFPSYFQDKGETHAATRWGVSLMFMIEHSLLFVGVLITFGVREVPGWVKLDQGRRDHERKQALLRQRVKGRRLRKAAQQEAAGPAKRPKDSRQQG